MSKNAVTKRSATQAPAASAKGKPKLTHEPAHDAVHQTGPRLQVDSEVARCIRQHARSHMKTEVCGVLIGENRDGIVEVQTSIEAVNATQAGTHVTFTQDAWESIYKIKDERYPDERIVGWYHSHPGFGVFLSEHDTFIHRNFFSSPDQVAWVYDPHTDEEGCFGWIDGEIHRVPGFSILDKSGDGIERTPKNIDVSQADPEEELYPTRGDRSNRSDPPPAWLRWTISGLSYLAALVVGFLIAYMLFPHFVPIPVDPSTGEPLLLQPRTNQQQPGLTQPAQSEPNQPQATQPNPSTTPTPNSAPNAAKPGAPKTDTKPGRNK